jgi:hypothetical protein
MATSTRSPDPVTLAPDTCRAHPRRQHLSHPGRWSAALVPALAALSLLLAACSQPAPTTSAAPPTAGAPTTAARQQATATATAGTSSGSPVKVYFSKHPESDSTPTAVFAVTRVAPNPQVATYAVQQLIAGPTAAEAAAGLYTTLGGWQPGASNCGGPDFLLTLNRKGTTPAQGTATLRFCRTVLLGGDLSGARISAEIEATLLQFATIHQVVILTPQGGCFDDFSGLNRCLR